MYLQNKFNKSAISFVINNLQPKVGMPTLFSNNFIFFLQYD